MLQNFPFQLILRICIFVFFRAATSQMLFDGKSEVVNVLSMSDSTALINTRTDCPFLWPGLIPFPDVTDGQDVSIMENVIIGADSIPPNIIINRITVYSDASLVFDDAVIDLHVREIYVMAGGFLYIGSETCRINSNINVTFHGSLLDSSTVDSPTGLTSKGLISEGSVDIHGKEYLPTWTRLSKPVSPWSTFVYLQQMTNWEVGQQIVLTTTVCYDCPVIYKASCEGKPHQNELRRIVGVSMDDTTQSYVIQIDRPLNYSHYAGFEYQGEVALLSRNVIVQGSQSFDSFGGHMKVKGLAAQGRFSGVEAINMGQLNILGRYPFHLHMMGESVGARNSYFQDCAVLNSQFRCYTIHGTNFTRISRNVAFNATGMCYYIEDGVEENNLFEYNLAAHVVPIYRPANGDWGQGGETFSAIPGKLLIPADTSAAGFYISNAMNTFIGNAASGGWSGFAFPNVAEPLGNYKGTMYPNNTYLPLHRPLKKFYGNTAHSSGFYWVAHGACIYVGAWLSYDSTGNMVYNSGRNARNSLFGNGSRTFMLFEETKTFLCNTGIAHWGNDARVDSAEMHDCALGAFFFGSSALHNGLVNTASKNPNNAIRYFANGWPGTYTRMGFQFYDTWVQTILSNVTFRHFHSALRGDCAVRYMDHSDHYTPQGINSVIKLTFQDVDPNSVVCIQHCGVMCDPKNNVSTMSSRMYSVWDWDGSLSGRGVPTIMGSNLDWWNWDNTCAFNTATHLWSCPWKFDYAGIGVAPYKSFSTGLPANVASRSVVFIEPSVGTLLSQGCDYAKFATCYDQYAPYTVGRMSQWGKPTTSNGIDLGPWAGVTGISNSGWYWRVKSTPYGIDGAPSAFNFGYFYQMAAGTFVVVAIAYPPTTQFTVQIDYWGNKLPFVPMSPSILDVMAPTENVLPAAQQDCSYTDWREWPYMCTNSGSSGFRWHFDGKHLYLRIVPFNCYSRMNSVRQACFQSYFEAYGAKVWNMQSGFKLSVTATCTGCTVQSVVDGVTYYTVADVPPSRTFESYTSELVPSFMATAAPSTRKPTTSQPSKRPSVTPSAKSTVTSTFMPSNKPIFPSAQPTSKSTIKPTFTPTNAPILPSNEPSAKSTVNPTYVPSNKPTNVPTPKSTATPTYSPSNKPIFPSNEPSSKSTFSPTTTKPTNEPSVKPTINPTNLPTIKPTSEPSAVPTTKPTPLPSTKPTTSPTSKATINPSREPTYSPTKLPSIGPSFKPTVPPTTKSSLRPTFKSTKTPV